MITHCLCHSSSGGGLLTLLPCSSVGSLSQAAVVHKLFQCESFPRGAVVQDQAAPERVPHGVTSPASKSAAAWAPRSMGPQVLPGACSSKGFPQNLSLLRASTCSGRGSATDCRWISAPPWTSMGCRGKSHLTMVFTTGCRGFSAPVSEASFFTDLGVCRVVSLTSSHSSLSTAVPQKVFPHLKCVITEALPLSLMGSALANGGSIREPADSDFI